MIRVLPEYHPSTRYDYMYLMAGSKKNIKFVLDWFGGVFGVTVRGGSAIHLHLRNEKQLDSELVFVNLPYF